MLVVCISTFSTAEIISCEQTHSNFTGTHSSLGPGNYGSNKIQQKQETSVCLPHPIILWPCVSEPTTFLQFCKLGEEEKSHGGMLQVVELCNVRSMFDTCDLKCVSERVILWSGRGRVALLCATDLWRRALSYDVHRHPSSSVTATTHHVQEKSHLPPHIL